MTVSLKGKPNKVTKSASRVGKRRIILPGSTIGILGGGQLGRMIALKAREMGYRIVTLDPSPDSPCGQVADHQIIAEFDHLESARKLAERSDVLTYEFENVDDDIVTTLEQEAFFPQGGRLLAVTRHRIREKTALQQAGVPVAPWLPVASRDELQQAASKLGLPCVLKTTMGGYDGKGQYVLRTMTDVEQAWVELGEKVVNNDRTQAEGGVCGETSFVNASGAQVPLAPFVAEGWVPFDKELSVIAARNSDGEIRTFPTAENIHRENILHLSIVPARISEQIDRAAQALAQQIAQKLDVVGLIAVEMFLHAGNLFVNELAPRPHNSGHFTMDACATSQFEQHVRAVCNLPLGEPRLLSPGVMVNILGEHLAPVLDKAALLGNGVKLHLYGKSEAKAKRKMGHLNILASSVEEAMQVVEQLQIWPN